MTVDTAFTQHQRKVIESNFRIYDPANGYFKNETELLRAKVIFLVSNLGNHVIREQQLQFIRAFADGSTCLFYPELESDNDHPVRSFKMFESLPVDLTVRGQKTFEVPYTDEEVIQLADLEYQALQSCREFAQRTENCYESCARVFTSFLQRGDIKLEKEQFSASPSTLAQLLAAHDFSRDTELANANKKMSEAEEKRVRFCEDNGILFGKPFEHLVLFQQGELPKMESALPYIASQYGRVIVFCPESYVLGNKGLFDTLHKSGISTASVVPKAEIERVWRHETNYAVRNMQMVEFEVHDGSLNRCCFKIPRQYLRHYPNEFITIVKKNNREPRTHDLSLVYSGTRNFDADTIVEIGGLDIETATAFVKLQLEQPASNVLSAYLFRMAFNCTMFFRKKYLGSIESNGVLSTQLSIKDHKWRATITSTKEMTFDFEFDSKFLAIEAEYLILKIKEKGRFILYSGRTIEFTDIKYDSLHAMRRKLFGFAGDKFLTIHGDYTVNSGSHYQITATTDVLFALSDTDESSKKRKDAPSQESDSE